MAWAFFAVALLLIGCSGTVILNDREESRGVIASLLLTVSLWFAGFALIAWALPLILEVIP